jgi:hypothetical protein
MGAIRSPARSRQNGAASYSCRRCGTAQAVAWGHSTLSWVVDRRCKTAELERMLACLAEEAMAVDPQPCMYVVCLCTATYSDSYNGVEEFVRPTRHRNGMEEVRF